MQFQNKNLLINLEIIKNDDGTFTLKNRFNRINNNFDNISNLRANYPVKIGEKSRLKYSIDWGAYVITFHEYIPVYVNDKSYLIKKYDNFNSYYVENHNPYCGSSTDGLSYNSSINPNFNSPIINLQNDRTINLQNAEIAYPKTNTKKHNYSLLELIPKSHFLSKRFELKQPIKNYANELCNYVNLN